MRYAPFYDVLPMLIYRLSWQASGSSVHYEVNEAVVQLLNLAKKSRMPRGAAHKLARRLDRVPELLVSIGFQSTANDARKIIVDLSLR